MPGVRFPCTLPVHHRTGRHAEASAEALDQLAGVQLAGDSAEALDQPPGDGPFSETLASTTRPVDARNHTSAEAESPTMNEFSLTVNGYTFKVSPALDARGVPVTNLPVVGNDQWASAMTKITEAAISLLLTPTATAPKAVASAAPKG